MRSESAPALPQVRRVQPRTRSYGRLCAAVAPASPAPQAVALVLVLALARARWPDHSALLLGRGRPPLPHPARPWAQATAAGRGGRAAPTLTALHGADSQNRTTPARASEDRNMQDYKISKLSNAGWQSAELYPADAPCGATIHRVQPSVASKRNLPDTAVGVRDLYQEVGTIGSKASGKMPFHLVIEPNGRLVQTAPLDRALTHARGCNRTHLGIACIGDFRSAAMPPAQHAALLGCLVGLVQHGGDKFKVDNIISHSAASKVGTERVDSPGQHVDMAALRQAVATEAGRQQYTNGYLWTTQMFEQGGEEITA